MAVLAAEGALIDMNNDALVAALGADAVAAVHGYRLQVISEAERRGLQLVSDALCGVVRLSADVFLVVDPIDIRLTFGHVPGRADLAGRRLTWGPGHGWSHLGTRARPRLSFYAGPHTVPLQLVPNPSNVLDWATDLTADRADRPVPDHSVPPSGVELDDDPEAIERLLGFIDPQVGLHVPEAYSQPDRTSTDPAADARIVVGRFRRAEAWPHGSSG